MYESTGLPLLRFYQCATPKADDDPLTNSQKPDEFDSAPKVAQATLKSQAGPTSTIDTSTTAAAPCSGLAGSSIVSEMVTTEDGYTGLLAAGSCNAGSAVTRHQRARLSKGPSYDEFMVQGSDKTLHPQNFYHQ